MLRNTLSTLRLLALAAHIGLLAAVALTAWTFTVGTAARAVLALILLLPLAASLPGLVRLRPSSLPWLATALVAYTGLGTVEVIATGTRIATALLLLALVELCSILLLSQRLRSRAPDATGER